MNNIKLLIQATNIHIANCDINIEADKIKKEKYERVLKNAYASCKHDFKEVPCMGANIVECKICGYEDGR